MAERIILDCDPGHDDAVAILLAVGNPDIDLIGVTTVGGNQSLDKVTYNARSVLHKAGEDNVPVYAGCDRPLVRPLKTAAYVHGETGLDGVELPDPVRPLENGHAVNYLVRTVMDSEPGTVTLVPTGPLTNIVMALRMEPKIAERAKQVVLMGGGVYEANSSACSEFNIYTDPEAAQIVFSAPWEVTMVGLDVTHHALCTRDIQRKIEAEGGKTGYFMGRLMDFFRKAYQENQDFDDPPVHDPCTVAYLIDPDVLYTERRKISVELDGKLTTGMTVVNMQGPEDPEANTKVALRLDTGRFWQIVEDAILRVDSAAGTAA